MRWKLLCRPTLLFGLGSLGAVSPYLFWLLGYDEITKSYDLVISYVPLWLWLGTFLMFVIGVSIAETNVIRLSRTRMGPMSSRRFRMALAGMCALAVVELILLFRFLGVIPLFAFATGYDITELHERALESFPGQFGGLTLTSFVLNFLVVLSALKGNRLARVEVCLTISAIVLSAFISVSLGKAQGLFISATFVFVSLATLTGHPINNLLVALRFRRLSGAATVVSGLVLVLIFGTVFAITRQIRLGAGAEENILQSGITAISNYLSWPLMNTEETLRASGLILVRENVLGWFTGLVPYKFVEQDQDLLRILLEPTSPLGLVGHTHWYIGLFGLLIFSCLLGFAANILFNSSSHSLLCAVIYAQLAWTLIAAHSYNHIVNLIFFPLPVLLFTCLWHFLTPAHRKMAGRNATPFNEHALTLSKSLPPSR